MRESPRIRRLRSDHRALQQLCAESTILDFTSSGTSAGAPPDFYTIRFEGRGFWRPEGSHQVLIRERHEMTIQLGAAYPRMMPELAWRSPVFHPNISGSGVVCLGGYGTYWVPSVNLDELCHMLWDMIRYKNFDVESPYNREAANWAKTQQDYRLPIDARPLRDKLAAGDAASMDGDPAGDSEVAFVTPEIVDAEIVGDVGRGEDPDILFID